MEFFRDCAECELLVIGIVVVIATLIDYAHCKSRKWGENPKKWGKR